MYLLQSSSDGMEIDDIFNSQQPMRTLNTPGVGGSTNNIRFQDPVLRRGYDFSTPYSNPQPMSLIWPRIPVQTSGKDTEGETYQYLISHQTNIEKTRGEYLGMK